jgi:hypothetical protein
MTFPEDLVNSKTVGLLLTKIDRDLALNIVMSGISLNSKKVADVLQACLIVSAQREFEAASKETQEKAEEIVEKAMGEFAERLQKTLTK